MGGATALEISADSTIRKTVHADESLKAGLFGFAKRPTTMLLLLLRSGKTS